MKTALAYLFLMLPGSSAYTGKCLLVRRSSDNDSMQIGFTPAGDLDTATLRA